MSKLFEYHVHTEFSNPTTVMDSVTSVSQYIERAKELGMTAMCFCEHGNVFQWTKKKRMINDAGMKYIHGTELYVTEKLQDNVDYVIELDSVSTSNDVSHLIKDIGGLKYIAWNDLKSHGEDIYLADDNKDNLKFDFFTGYLRKKNNEFVYNDIIITHNRIEQIKKRDNYHIILIAKNFEGIKEINNLLSIANNREDGHFYYVPRITYEELKNTSDNVFITSACLGGILNHGSKELKKDFISFCQKNKHRCFLEIQHHNVKDQKEYNLMLKQLSDETGIELIAGTDAHSIDEEHSKGREVLQASKETFFDGESGWDLIFKGYDDLVLAFEKQGVLDSETVERAIKNTKVIEEQVEDFEFDRSHKYPELYDNAGEVLKRRVAEAIVKKNKNIDEIRERVNIELHDIIYEMHENLPNFLLMEYDMKKYLRENGIVYGVGRGSVGGSYVAYLLDIHLVDSIKHDLIFERFLNKERVSLGDYLIQL